MPEHDLVTDVDPDDGPRTDPTAIPRVKMARVGGRKVPHPKKKQPATYRVLPREQRNGLLIVNTGDGKGKTTAALGVLMRAAGRDMKVGMFQFIKSERVAGCGEHLAAKRLGVDIVPLGDGCTRHKRDVTEDCAAAGRGWTLCRETLASGEYDILVLDELTYPINFGWLSVDEVVQAIASRPRGTHVIVTGRNAPQALVDAADLVTEMRVIKHPFREQGIRAQAGIDV